MSDDDRADAPPALSESAGRFVGNALAGFGSLARFFALLFGVNLAVGSAVRSVAGVALVDLPFGYEGLLGLLASGVVVAVADDRVEDLSVGSVWLFGTVAFVVGLAGQTTLASLNGPLRGSLWLTLDVALVWVAAFAVAFAVTDRGGLGGITDALSRGDAVRDPPDRATVESKLGDEGAGADEPDADDGTDRRDAVDEHSRGDDGTDRRDAVDEHSRGE
jgi:hypothetical protein